MADLNNNTYWSETDASNNSASPNGWPEGMMPSGVNDTARADRGALKRFWDRINPVQTVTPSGGVWTLTTANTSYPAAYVDGEIFAFRAATPSVGNDLFRVNALAAKPIYVLRNGWNQILAQDIVTGGHPMLTHDSTLNAGAGGFALLNSGGGTTGEFVDVFAIGGQSNAQGCGTAGTVTVPVGKVLQYKAGAGTISDANDPIGDGPNIAQTGCAFPAFGVMYYAATGRTICFVPSAVGNTPQCAAVGSPNWDTSGTLRGQLIANFSAACAALRAAGYRPIVKGILWSQGENDAGGIQASMITQATYQTALITMINYYRATAIDGTVYPQLPFYISQTAGPAAGDNTYYQQIRVAQAAMAAGDPQRTYIAFGGTADFIAKGLVSPTAGGSNLHYTQDGYNKMGREMAQAVVAGGQSASRAALSRQLLQLNSHGVAGAAGQTVWVGVGLSAGTSDIAVWHLTPFAGTVRNLEVYLGTAPGVGQSVVGTVMVGSAPTPVTFTISGANTHGTDLINAVSISAGLSVSLRLVYSAGAASSIINGSVELDSP